MISKGKIQICELESDILVIGGGMAGFFAAVRATEKGQKVIMVDKGTVGRSGFTPWANTFSIYDESLGDRKEEWIKGAQSKGEYLVNLDYFAMQIEDSLKRYNQLMEWGIVDSRPEWKRESQEPARKYLSGHDRRMLLPKILKEAGVTMVQRVMITALLKSAGLIAGAVGFHGETGEAFLFKAKATILCTGAGGYKAPGYPIHSCTFDGDAMAYRVGARIAGKDFMDFHFTGDSSPWDVFEMEEEVFVNRIYPTKGPTVEGIGASIAPVFEVHKEAPPLKGFMPEDELSADSDDPRGKGYSIMPRMPKGNIVMNAATGLGVHKSEGIWPADDRCFSGVTGLYAAGDALASMICGAAYPSTGLGLSGSAVQGYRAGEEAAKFAAQVDMPDVPGEITDSEIELMVMPLHTAHGFNPRWVSQVLLNTMAPYYILLFMKEDRLKSALSQIEFLQEHIVPRMRAGDNHELRLVHETCNMVLNAEMKLRACMMRTESRGNHYREDYPARNDKDWLAWILISKGSGGGMLLKKEAVPEAWKGNLSEPYTERYPRRFPGELEFLGISEKGR
ncbi:MAG: FAD-binding protein [Candidatus Eremiobacteraeota bacterium]|nr:FAD-binding protein [Candidatus Eremiobacteraeota bacterium]